MYRNVPLSPACVVFSMASDANRRGTFWYLAKLAALKHPLLKHLLATAGDPTEHAAALAGGARAPVRSESAGLDWPASFLTSLYS